MHQFTAHRFEMCSLWFSQMVINNDTSSFTLSNLFPITCKQNFDKMFFVSSKNADYSLGNVVKVLTVFS